MVRVKHALLPFLFVLATPAVAETTEAPQRTMFSLDAQATGVAETIDNILNVTVVSKDANDLRAEYRAGFVQGKLQAKGIRSARDNSWDESYLLDPGHAFPKQPSPTRAELDKAGGLLTSNYDAFIAYVKNPSTDAKLSHQLKRVLFRMVGIYHGATLEQAAELDFSGTWLPDASYFKAEELKLGYETAGLSFMDVYYLNAYNDLGDVITYMKEPAKQSSNANEADGSQERAASNDAASPSHDAAAHDNAGASNDAAPVVPGASSDLLAQAKPAASAEIAAPEKLAATSEAAAPEAISSHPEKCSAFLKRVGDDILLTHNSWQGFLSQTMNMTLAVNNDLMTFNAATPGLIASGTDFGYNNKGMMFNETTHRMAHTVVKPNGMWIFWRAALAEQFSTSIDDFFRYISLDNSGTYLNGYMLANANTGETGLVEMSYRCFVYYHSTGGAYSVSAKSLDGQACSTQYDPEMVKAEHLLGINYPASLQVRTDLQSTDNRPARRHQFMKLLPGVTDVATAKTVITYTDPANPLSIFGRWDLGYGETAYPKMVPDGSIDAKTANLSMVRSFMKLSGELDMQSPATGFWMRYGTPTVNGAPFVWSQSNWKWQKLRDVPDRVDGQFALMPLHIR